MPRKSKSPRRKSPIRKNKSPRGEYPAKKVFFQVWYESKPNIRNPTIKCENLKVGLDDDDEWLLTGITNSSTPTKIKTWLRSLGTIKKVYGKQRLQVGY
jgi:hypothetical protein